jgi:hypothetical protein
VERSACLPLSHVIILTQKLLQVRKIYKAIQKIQGVSGWHWDNQTGASITAATASSWDAYVKAHSEAKNFRNTGWVHLCKVAEIMPSAAAGGNVYHPTTAQPSQPTPSSQSPASRSPSPSPLSGENSDSDKDTRTPSAPLARKCAREPATPTKPRPKRARKSHGAAAILDMSASISDFGTKIAAALAPPSASMGLNPTPIRLSHAVTRASKLEKWLSAGERVAFINLLRADKNKPGEVNKSAIDTYMALDEDDVRQEFVRDMLIEAGVIPVINDNYPSFDF